MLEIETNYVTSEIKSTLNGFLMFDLLFHPTVYDHKFILCIFLKAIYAKVYHGHEHATFHHSELTLIN